MPERVCPVCRKRPAPELGVCATCAELLETVNADGALEVTYAKVEEDKP